MQGHETVLFDLNFDRSQLEIPCRQICGDVTKLEDLTAVAIDADLVIHCAAVSRAELAERQPQRCMNVNVIGLDNVLRWSLRQKTIPYVVFTSSREVYGNPSSLPVTELQPRRPRSTYGISKALGEDLLAYYGYTRKIHYTILRLSNLYGSLRDIPERVVPIFVRNALSDSPLTVFGGEQVLDFTFIDDAIDGIVQLIEAIRVGKREVYDAAYNIASGRGTSIEDLAQLIKAACASGSEISFLEGRDFDARAFIGDYSRAKADFGYNPKVSLEDGIRLYVKKFSESS
jgi:nucleoside-diphosphate-sugar epimerase